MSAPRRNIVVAGYEFQERIQRGIYLYTKSLLAAMRHKGHGTAILTEADHLREEVPMLSWLYHTINEPRRLRASRKRVLWRYGTLRWLKRRHASRIENNKPMTTEENLWFLRDVDSFLNIPRVYDTTHVVNRLWFEQPLDLSYAADYGYDTLFTSSPLAVASSNPRLKVVQTIHDLIPLEVTTHFEPPAVFYRRLKAGADRADMMLAVSEYTRNRFIEAFPYAADRIKVVYQPLPADPHALHLSELPLVQASVLEKFGLKPGGYCFYVGAIEGRKNIHRLIAAHALVASAEDCPLVLAGSADKDYVKEHNLTHIFAKPSVAGAADGRSSARGKTRYVGYVTEIEKLCLLRNARFFAFPSLSEGFGIPALEAQTLGCPVLTTNVASLPEVVGDTAALVQDPFNIEEMAVMIQRLLEDGEYRASLREAGLINAQRFDKERFADNVDALLALL